MSSYIPSCNPPVERISQHVAFWHLTKRHSPSSSHILTLLFTAHWSLNGQLCNFLTFCLSTWERLQKIACCCRLKLLVWRSFRLWERSTLSHQHQHPKCAISGRDGGVEVDWVLWPRCFPERQLVVRVQASCWKVDSRPPVEDCAQCNSYKQIECTSILSWGGMNSLFTDWDHLCVPCPCMDILLELLKSWFRDLGEAFFFICLFLAQNTVWRRSLSTYIDFISGSWKLAIWLTSRNQTKTVGTVEPVSVLKGLLKARLGLKHAYYRMMDTLQALTSIWAIEEVMCSLREDGEPKTHFWNTLCVVVVVVVEYSLTKIVGVFYWI